MELIVHLGDRFAQCSEAAGRPLAGTARAPPRALLAGQLTAPIFLLPGAAIDLFAIRFEPWGAAALLRLDAAELRDAIVPLDAVVGAEADRLVAALCSARDAAERVAAAAAWCRRLAATAWRAPAAWVALVREAQRTPSGVTVARMAERIGGSARQLERDFARRARGSEGNDEALHSDLLRRRAQRLGCVSDTTPFTRRG